MRVGLLQPRGLVSRLRVVRNAQRPRLLRAIATFTRRTPGAERVAPGRQSMVARPASESVRRWTRSERRSTVACARHGVQVTAGAAVVARVRNPNFAGAQSSLAIGWPAQPA